MIVKRGEQWGTPTAAPIDALEVRSDAAIADAVTSARPRPVVVRGGDLHRSLGTPAGPAATTRLPIDVIRVTADGRRLVAVGHVVVRQRGRLGWWRDRIVGVMNVDHLGAWDAAPRAHPNDGWLDVIEVAASMSVRARWQAWRRMPAGNHVPHPDIAVRRVRAQSFAFVRALGLWVDGVEQGTVRALQVEVEPDAAEIYV